MRSGAGRAARRRQFGRRAPCTGAATAAWVLGLLVCWMAAPVSSAAPAALVGLAVLAAVDGLWSFVALSRVAFRVATPTDLTVDAAALIEVEVERPRVPVVVRMVSAPRGTSAVAVPGRPAVLRAVPHRRGVFEAAEFEVRVTAPLGILGFRRYVVVPFGVPVAIAPAATHVEVLRERTVQGSGAEHAEPSRAGELSRGARPYEPGDSLRRVHWPATARAGELMVRDAESVRDDVVVLVVDLGDQPGAEAERLARRGRGAAEELLRRGHRLELVTRERRGEVHAPVADALGVGRRLAAAVPGPPIERAEGWLAVHP